MDSQTSNCTGQDPVARVREEETRPSASEKLGQVCGLGANGGARPRNTGQVESCVDVLRPAQRVEGSRVANVRLRPASGAADPEGGSIEGNPRVGGNMLHEQESHLQGLQLLQIERS